MSHKLDLNKLFQAENQLPKQKEFILHLQNSNYSAETIYNYHRDLTFLAKFLKDSAENGAGKVIPFQKIDKNTITLYKGWLTNRKHIEKPLTKRETQSKGSKSNENGKDILLASGKKGKNVQNQEKSKNLTERAKASAILSQRAGLRSTSASSVKNNDPDQLDARSLNRILTSLRNYLRYLIEFDLETPLAPDAIKLVRAPRKKPRIPELDELIQLVEAPTTLEPDKIVALRNRAVLELLLASGMRISEVVNLNRDQLNDEGKLFITGKGNKQRFVYLTDRAVEHLAAYLEQRTDPYPALFIPYRGTRSKSGSPRLSENYIQGKIAQYRRILGIVVPTSAHTIRHGFATYLAERGANPAAIQVLLGHESLQTTTRYVHASDRYAEETHKKYHPVRGNRSEE